MCAAKLYDWDTVDMPQLLWSSAVNIQTDFYTSYSSNEEILFPYHKCKTNITSI